MAALASIAIVFQTVDADYANTLEAHARDLYVYALKPFCCETSIMLSTAHSDINSTALQKVFVPNSKQFDVVSEDSFATASCGHTVCFSTRAVNRA